MSDLIDRQVAIEKFEPWLKVNGYSEGELNMLRAVLYELRFLPSAQPEILACGEGELNVPDTNVGDTISRQAAIDALAKFVPYAICDESTESYTNGLTDAYNLILQLPSADTVPVVRCKDCVNWDTSWSVRANGHHYCAVMDTTTDGCDYCSNGERRDG